MQNYVDRDAGPGALDATCGPRSYDGHKGTDFAVPDTATMIRGVDVLAAADGVVQGVRDGVEDVQYRSAGAPSVEGRECGNGVALKGADGWSMQYCHMRKGSVRVKIGDRVKAGDHLGQIGMSGKAQFPHLHLQIKRGDAFIDPFGAVPMTTACGAGQETLWAASSEIAYTPGGIMSIGIIDEPADYKKVLQNSPHLPEMSPSSAAMVIWAHFYGLADDDELYIEIVDPDEDIVVKMVHQMDRDRARQMRFTGARRKGNGWQKGVYQGRAELRRNGKIIAQRTIKTQIR